MSATPVPLPDSGLEQRLARIRARVSAACQHAHRESDAVTVVAISKTFPATLIRKAYALGLVHVGENRVQELLDKFGDGSLPRECPGLQLHLVGHLQTNKVRKALQFVSSIDSVDSLRLAETIDREAVLMGRRVRILLEVNTSGEPQKYGLPPEEVVACAEQVAKLGSLDVRGLMTVGPLTDDAGAIRQSFALLRSLFEQVKQEVNPPLWSVLSMGMSGDFEVAVEEGATEIRLGTVLFGERSVP
jgi:pyridoxal phosphate enzyme (YggS family)